MAEIKKLVDKNNVQFFPVTHINAVVGSDNTSLSEELASKQDAIEAIQVSIDGTSGTPSGSASMSGNTLSFSFSGIKGNDGATGPQGPTGPAGVTSAVVNVDNTSGTPSATATVQDGVLTINISGIKGEHGNPGSSQDYPFELENSLNGGTNKALTAEQGKVLDGKVTQLGQDLYGGTEEKLLPTATWMDQTFGTSWGGNQDNIYIDLRNEIDESHKIKQFKIYGRATGTIRVYFLRKIDFSVVKYQDVTIANTNTVSTFDISLNDSDYLDEPMYVGIWSSIVWGSLAGAAGDYPNTYIYSIANNTITSASTRAWGYSIVIEEITRGVLDNVDERLDSIETNVNSLFPVCQTLPSSDWLDGQFQTNGGGSADYVYFDSRCIVPENSTVKTIRIKATGAGTAVIYRISATNQLLESQTVDFSAGVNTIIPSFTASDGEKVGVSSASSIIGMRPVNTGEEKNTYTIRISTGTLTQSNYHLGIEVYTETNGAIENIDKALVRLDNSVSVLNDAIFEDKTLPSAEWIGGAFSSNGGGDANYAYFDTRTEIPIGATLERVRMKATGSGNVTVYLLKASDYSILATSTKQIVAGINEITPSFDESYFSVPTFIAVGSASAIIAMRNTSGTSEMSYTNRLTISSGDISEGRAYIVAIEVKYTAIKRSTISSDLAEAIAQGGNDIVLGPYDYAVKSPIVLSSGMTIRGSFGKTRLVLTDGCQTAITASNADGIKISDLEIVGTCPNYRVEMNGIIAGTGYDLVETEADAIALNYMGSEKGIYLYYCENVVLENLRINHIDGSAIRVNHTGMNYTKGLNACNLFITNCYNGIYCENEHEFSQYTNWTVTSCMIGVYVASGNLIFTAGHATRCRFAMMFVAGTNHAHGVVNGIEIKHNQVAGIFCYGVVYGEFFEGVYLSYSPLVIRDSTGVYFDDIMVSNMSIDVTGTTGVNKISKLVKRNNSISIVNTDTLTILETVQLY